MDKYPLIFIPGILGSKIQAYDKSGVLSVFPNQWFDGWWDAWPATAESWISRLEFSSPSTPIYKSRCTGLVEKVYAGEPPATRDLQDVYILTINHLNSLGYEKDKSLFLYAYDFRYDLDLISDSKQDISGRKSLNNFIEEVQKKTSSSKVNLICHSLGGLVTLNYLTRKPDRIKNVNRIVFLGTPVFGAAKAYAGLICGFSPDPIYDYLAEVWTPTHLQWKKISRFFYSIYQLMPSKPLVEGTGSFVSIQNQDLNYEQSYAINNEDLINNDTIISKELLRSSYRWKEGFTKSLKNNWHIFNPYVHFIQGNKIATPIRYSITYPQNWELGESNIITSEDGDGTVLNYGLQEYLGVNPQNIRQFDGESYKHLDLATNPEVLTYAINLLSLESN